MGLTGTGNYSIVFGDHIPLEGFPTVVVPSTGELGIKRITYLSEVRNRMMAPLDPPPSVESRPANYAVNHTTTRFDKILFLNDIYYRPEDAMHLLFSTNYNRATNRSEYLANCAMDFIRGGTLYDSFVIRDLDGYEISWFLYPWFTIYGTGQSRKDILAQKDAVRVRSCWSGLAAYDATPFLRSDVLAGNAAESSEVPKHKETSKNTLKGIASTLSASFSTAKQTEDAAEEAKAAALASDSSDLQLPMYPPLRFRHETELFWESSECCLVNADLLARHPSIGSSHTGIYLNPYVRVAYDQSTFGWQPIIQRFERGFVIIEYVVSLLGIKPEYNPRRTEMTGLSAVRRVWSFDDQAIQGYEGNNSALVVPVSEEERGGRWVNTKVDKALPGGFCGQRRLFVMLRDLEKANRGNEGTNWEKIDVPKGS
jgi:hypothetical protein